MLALWKYVRGCAEWGKVSLRTIVGCPATMPELQEEDCALCLDCLDHWLPSLNLLLCVDARCMRVPDQSRSALKEQSQWIISIVP